MADLARLLKYELDIDLEREFGTGSLTSVVFNMINWFNARGHINDLLRVITNDRPENHMVQQVVHRLLDRLPSQGSGSSESVARGSQDTVPLQNLPTRATEIVGRDDALKQISACFNESRARGLPSEYVVHGHGGLGKTSLAVEYALLHAGKYPGGVFFLRCSMQLDNAISELDFYKTQRQNNLDNNSPTVLFKKHLLDSTKPVLLILDDVQTLQEWTNIHGSGFASIKGVDVLITTKLSRLPVSQVYPLCPLTTEDGISLLSKFRADANSNSNHEASAEIAHRVGGIPFALSIIGIYMRKNPALPWREYQKSLTEHGLETLRQTEELAGTIPGKYAVPIDKIMNDLLQSLSEAERRAIEYTAILSTINPMEYILIGILKHDKSLAFRPIPGYSDPATSIIDTLARDGILLSQGERGLRHLGLHELLRQKVLDDLRSNRKNLDSLHAGLFQYAFYLMDFEPIATSEVEDKIKTMRLLTSHSYSLEILQLLHREGHIHDLDSVIAFRNQHLDSIISARKLATRLGGETVFKLSYRFPLQVHLSIQVCVKTQDITRAQELIAHHNGRMTVTEAKEGTIYIIFITTS
ncbi:NB-ARC domain protein [Aquisphaera giovannonii]|uniref:NB-ARC domain protein n=2 Tax=Aquisphaera giovannonii TaxID=406548 RepID=A0A5B9W3B9_9BACT|nr:NB-ARC domain protein [Aquisphaera giovannonii]